MQENLEKNYIPCLVAVFWGNISRWRDQPFYCALQVNLCQKLLFWVLLIFESTNPQYLERLFIESQVQYMKITSSNLGIKCCVQKLFLTFRKIFVHNMFSPCSAKRRASDKDLLVHTRCGLQLQCLDAFIYLYWVVKKVAFMVVKIFLISHFFHENDKH